MSGGTRAWQGLYPHPYTAVAFCGQLLGYILLSTTLQVLFYHRQRGREYEWKIQPARTPEPSPKDGELALSGSRGVPESGGAPFVWWLPALGLWWPWRMQGRHPLHARYCTFNLLMASTFVAVLVEGCMRGWNQLSAGACTVSGASVVPLPVGWPFVKAVATQSFVEYYWHRLMHWRPCYKALHKLHHHYKSPRPFDDLFIHPLEAVGYYTILYIIPTHLLGRMPVGDFACYLALHGLFGVLDHCGVNIAFGALYAAADHDAHHQHFNVNYGFPWIVMDLIHGTAQSSRQKFPKEATEPG